MLFRSQSEQSDIVTVWTVLCDCTWISIQVLENLTLTKLFKQKFANVIQDLTTYIKSVMLIG